MKRSRGSLVLTLTITFVLMALMVIFTSRVVYRTAFKSAQELGDDKTTAISADLENYLDTAKSVLWLTADTVDHMVESGATDEEIIEYITRESANTEQRFDESYTGIYGVIRGNYVDGVGWVPPSDYEPTERDWYKTTVAGEGDVVIVSPYVDAQTGNVIISVGRALSDHNNALAMDLTLSGVQEIVEGISINGYGYGYIVNYDGLVVAHRDKSENGKNYKEKPEQQELLRQIEEKGKGNFSTTIDGEKCTVFFDTVMDQWYLVIITKNSELYHEPTNMLFVSILISLIVYILISVFYILGFSKEQRSYAKMEELKEIERRKDYEARVLKLEKSAADSANKAKSDFLADMSHEIRTPINAILGMNEMILHEAEDEEILDYAESIKSSGTTLLSIINTILDFSKIEDGRMNLVPVEFETAGFINSLVNSISERARTKNLDFRVEVDETIPSILYGDDVRISQVIMNLLTNAVKYTEKGWVLLKITNLGEQRDGIWHLLISVKDTGIGIRKEDIDKLSVSFERLDEKRNRHIEGTGLGISIVTKLLDMMGSSLQIKSEYGEGSEFYFDLPIEVIDLTPIGNYSAIHKNLAKNSESRISIRAPKARVLLTDDNEMNRKVAANLLRLFGVEPVLCGSGRETIEFMKKDFYDILFLDHMMPEMDGIETLRLLKERGLTRNTKVIALTANAVVGAKEQYMKEGFDDYLPKPVNLSDLERILKKYLPEYESIDTEEEPVRVEEDLLKEGEKSETFKDTETEFGKTKSGKIVSGKTESGKTVSGKDVMEKLRSRGLNVEEGITYCGGEEEFYLEIIHDYIDATPQRIAELNDLYAQSDWKNYKIQIHSVKSASKTIGAMELFEKAKALETAAADEDIKYLGQNHESVMAEYKELSQTIESFF